MYRILDNLFKFLFVCLAVFVFFLVISGIKVDKIQLNNNNDFSAEIFYREIQSITNINLIKRLSEKPSNTIKKSNYSKLKTGYYSALCGFDNSGNYHPTIGDRNFKEVALTFDIGNFSAGEYLLDLLKKENVKATMFLANNRSYKILGYSNNRPIYLKTLEETKTFKKFRQLILRMHREGHEVGNHTWNHHNWKLGIDVGRKRIKVTKKHLTLELAKVNKRYKEITGVDLSPIWRAPFGAVDYKIVKWAEEAGYQHIFWTHGLDSLDWTNPFSAVDTISFLKKNMVSGGVMLFHLGNDLRKRKDKIHHKLQELITWLKNNNYKMVTVTQLLDKKNNTDPNFKDIKPVFINNPTNNKIQKLKGSTS